MNGTILIVGSIMMADINDGIVGDDVKVEYSFAYTKGKNDELKIILHDSHLPYTPAEKH